MGIHTARAAKTRGFTLIESALVLSLTGIMLAAFLPTFLRHVRTSKLTEATAQLASLHAHASAYYGRAQGSVGSSVPPPCLPASAGPYPPAPSPSPVMIDFAADATGAPTWSALGQITPAPLRYAYEVEVLEPGCRARTPGAVAVWFRAHGDLDGDGEPSLLERAAAPSRDGAALVPVGPLRILARTE